MPHPEIRTGSIMLEKSMTPTSTTPGQPGMIAWDASYLYICTATNTWKKVALSSLS